MAAITPVKLSIDLTENVNSRISSLNLKGTLLKIAAIVSAVALVLIFSGMSMIYLGLIVSPPVWGVAIALLSGLAAFKGLNLWSQGNASFAESASLTKIAEKIKTLDSYSEDDVRNYFQENKLHALDERIIEALAKINSEAPLMALVPLIAQELVLKDSSDQFAATVKEHTTGIERHRDKPIVEAEYINLIMLNRMKIAVTTIARALVLQGIQMPEHKFEILVSSSTGKQEIFDTTDPHGTSCGRIISKSLEHVANSYLAIPGATPRSKDFLITLNDDHSEGEMLTIDDLVLDLDSPEEGVGVAAGRIPGREEPLLTVADVRMKLFG